MSDRPGSQTAVQITRVRAGQVTQLSRRDDVVTEEPLEIRLVAGGETRRLAVTMRTPGADFELVAGFLFAEGIIRRRDDIVQMSYCVDSNLDEAQQYNVVNAKLRETILPDWRMLDRHFMVSSACGVCGKASIEALEQRGLQPLVSDVQIPVEVVGRLSSRLREAQRLFDRTGGLHAAALFNLQGELLALREDVGRHNALDKLIGRALLDGHLPLEKHIVVVSGRASFELAQKALGGLIPVFCAVSAPSSLAVRLARRFNMTLIGFLREADFNIYCGHERIIFHQM